MRINYYEVYFQTGCKMILILLKIRFFQFYALKFSYAQNIILSRWIHNDYCTKNLLSSDQQQNRFLKKTSRTNINAYSALYKMVY